MRRVWVPLLAIAVAGLARASLLHSAMVKSEEQNGTATYATSSLLHDSLGRKPVKGEAQYNDLFVKQRDNINSIILGPILSPLKRAQVPHFLVTWLRNWLAGTVLYLLLGGGWYFWTYWWRREQNFPKGNSLAKAALIEQLVMGLLALPALTALPSFAEYIVEKGWTLCYVEIAEVGWANWTMHVGAYLVFVQFWVYWVHRWSHTPIPYKYLHYTHHFYHNINRPGSPFAGLAFNPIDGIVQASPVVFALFFIPMHFQTYKIFLFLDEIWSANIHDTIDGGYFGILGAGYHNYHHTHYKYNYGHLTTAMDWLFGTLLDPKTGPAGKMAKEKTLKSS